ncbi:hypothetical protein HPP92_014880 [Vanilla planifolia]|uniref:Uncharacterized protein n=1 Tax=Vanilla planifolia TaxID=51239 RepID=A0A835UTJ5_VANPL|nr:hypothetical protein HPP92_014880 [Vanilla planifolia]
MAWKRITLDLFVPLGFLVCFVYHCWLWYTVKKRPHGTSVGLFNANQQLWIAAMLKDNDQKNLVVVHGLRNSLVGSCLVASSAFAACVGLLSLSSSVDRVVVIEKCAALLLCFAAVFLCETMSITLVNELSLVINTLILRDCPVTEEQLAVLLRKAALLSAIGHRLFFAAMPLLLWFFGPVLVFVASVAVVVALYVADVARREKSVENVAAD